MWMLLQACLFLGTANDTGATLADGGAADGGEPEQSGGCEELEFGYDGPDPPIVGDTWVVWPVCDGAMGTSMRIIIDPVNNAVVADNYVTFTVPGPISVTLRYGSQTVTREVEVGE